MAASSVRLLDGAKGASLLVGLAIVGILMTLGMGGDAGGFLFVTLNFVFLPLLSLVVAGVILWSAFRSSGVGWRRYARLVWLPVPAVFIYLAATGDLIVILRRLGLGFR